MELKLNKEPVFLNEVIFDGQTEQGVEFDYVLPDYYPDIFKILKCTIAPGIVSYSVSGTQLFYDGSAVIKVMYLSEDNGDIQCIEQRYTYQKTVELAKPCEKVKACVKIQPKTDYVNCRAISPRRLDVRGAVSCKIKVSAVRETEIISAAEELEVKRVPLTYCSDKLVSQRQFVVREDIETGSSSGSIACILTTDACAEVTDTKVIANKAVVKGSAKVKALYIVKNDNLNAQTEVMEAEIPLSQIIDIDGITDSHTCYANFCVMECALNVKTGDSGENKMFSCTLTVDCTVNACRESTVSIITDVYSTSYETAFTKAPARTEFAPQVIVKQLAVKGTLECAEGSLAEIYDCRCDISNVICRQNDDGELIISGQCNYQAIGCVDGGGHVFIEKSEAFEVPTDIAKSSDGCTCSIEPDVQVENVSFSIANDKTVEVRAILLMSGCLYQMKNVDIIKDIQISTEKPKEKSTEYALKMYYAEQNEDVWDIAKHYNTSSAAIIAENDLEAEILAEPCMLLIPIV